MHSRIATLRHREKCLQIRQQALDEANAEYTLMMNVAKQEFQATTVEQRRVFERARRSATEIRNDRRREAYRAYGMAIKTPTPDQ